MTLSTIEVEKNKKDAPVSDLTNIAKSLRKIQRQQEALGKVLERQNELLLKFDRLTGHFQFLKKQMKTLFSVQAELFRFRMQIGAKIAEIQLSLYEKTGKSEENESCRQDLPREVAKI